VNNRRNTIQSLLLQCQLQMVWLRIDPNESTVTPTVSKAVGSSKPVSSLSSSLSGLRIGSSNISPSSGHGSSRPRLKLAPRTKPVPKLEVDPHYLQNTKKKMKRKRIGGRMIMRVRMSVMPIPQKDMKTRKVRRNQRKISTFQSPP